jgi:hypothetical protein
VSIAYGPIFFEIIRFLQYAKFLAYVFIKAVPCIAYSIVTRASVPERRCI